MLNQHMMRVNYPQIRCQFILIIYTAKMGSSQNKDEFVDLYMEVNRPYYVAGDTVEGCVYINAKATRNYKNLVIRLRGDEYVEWTEHHHHGQHHHHTEYHHNQYQNYDSVFTIIDFNGQLNQGQYIFPFSFLLPQELSGSFRESGDNFIRYSLLAVINHPTKVDNAQIFKLYLNIQEPVRQNFQGMSKNQGFNSKCCGCCIDYGIITINMTCDKNFAMNGDSLVVSGFIDQSQGKDDIESAEIILQEKRILISDDNRVNYEDDQEYQLGKIGSVRSGETKNFNVPIKIPQKLNHYTAIGSITARYFLLTLRADLGCCADPNPQISLHLVIQSNQPELEVPKKMDPPGEWAPNQAPQTICNTMRKFEYKPSPFIHYRNEFGNEGGSGGVKPYFSGGSMERMV